MSAEALATTTTPRFKAGDRVRIDDRPSLGHCRTPYFLRGKTGTITEVVGSFRNPESLAYHKPGMPKMILYRVRFSQGDLWPGYKGPPGDELEADIYENWLTPGAKGR